ncbi:Unknown protein sequence [Pseudomonas savastanoi pv. retacarpa]|nr:Unknown protein sequence [Pseudomonas savastanoi pv. retacarpa]
MPSCQEDGATTLMGRAVYQFGNAVFANTFARKEIEAVLLGFSGSLLDSPGIQRRHFPKMPRFKYSF